MRQDRFHGRVGNGQRLCDWPGCDHAGEFRAPGIRPSGFDGPGDFRWFCLDHIRAFNAGYDYFAGMSPEEIWHAQSPIAGWQSETRAFSPTAGIDSAPRWSDFADPLEAIQQRARARAAHMRPAQWPDGRAVSGDERSALEALALDEQADRRALRQRYSELVRRYHPDRNGGDRSHEAALQKVIEAYQLLKVCRHFA